MLSKKFRDYYSNPKWVVWCAPSGGTPHNRFSSLIVTTDLGLLYGHPIRILVRTLCPDMSLVDLLQTIPSLHLQKVDNQWRIALKVD